ncbi:MAG: hypothetical protein JW750_10670 [Anaerolineaceae bacterium]|nr:hypothetical protein [Anaerolineaceae bacterium]
MKKYILLVIGIVLWLMIVGCQSERISPEDIAQPSLSTSTPILTATAVVVDQAEIPVEPTATEFPLPTPAGTATPFVYEGLSCYRDDLPYAYEQSAAVLGWKYFADKNGIAYRVIYFPESCRESDIEQDVEQLFFLEQESDETILILMDAFTQGRMGKLYDHLLSYDFWAMGPEDYPMILDTNRYVNPNLILFRADRLNGEGDEGNEVLGLMVGLGEHEYIHTVQARNNPDLAEMIWSDAYYRSYIERYANLNNNSGERYFRASYSFLNLIQMLDGLYTQGTLEASVTRVLEGKGMALDDFMSRPVLMYDSHFRALLVNVAEQKYVDHLIKQPLNPLMLVARAGVGDMDAYDLVRSIYNQEVEAYNLWYYGSNSSQYLPSEFDELFNPY